MSVSPLGSHLIPASFNDAIAAALRSDADERLPLGGRGNRASREGFASVASAPDRSQQADDALAWGELSGWIERGPSERCCWAVDRLNGLWRVGLEAGGERFTAARDKSLASAIRNALMIATFAGHK